MNNLLVISAVGDDRPGIVNELSKAILEAGGNIEDSRMAVLGGEFALMLLISGTPAAVRAVQDALPALQENLNLTIIAKPTTTRAPRDQRIPYDVEVVAMDHPGIVHEVAKFFSGRDINIEQLDTATYAAAHTGTPMFSLTMTISVPAAIAVNRLRDEFLAFCDDLNLDATLVRAR